MNGQSSIWSERWRLAALSKEDLAKIALISIMVGMAYVMFHLLGNTTEIRMYGRSVLRWMISYWNNPRMFGGVDYTHGWLIAPVSLWLVWTRRKDIAAAEKSVSRIGLAVVILALLLHWFGAKAQQTRLSLAALVLLLWAVPFYLYGWGVAKQLIFPCSYLIFCIPLNFLDSFTFPLRIFSTSVSTALLNGLGIPVLRKGSTFTIEGVESNFEVEEACSGIRSMLAMTALTAVYAYLTQKTLTKKWILFLSCIPLAVIGNTARIVTVALVAKAFGRELAVGLYHDYSGYVFFSVAIGCMVAVGSLLNTDLRKVWKQWKRNLLGPISSSSVS